MTTKSESEVDLDKYPVTLRAAEWLKGVDVGGYFELYDRPEIFNALVTMAHQMGRQLAKEDLAVNNYIQEVLKQERELYDLIASLGTDLSAQPISRRPKITDRVVRIEVFHRLPLTVFNPYGEDTNYYAMMWVRAWTEKGYRVQVADITGLDTGKVDEKIRMISQLFQEITGKEISFVRRGRKNLYLEADSASLPQYLQKVNLDNYMELKRLWSKRFGK